MARSESPHQAFSRAGLARHHDARQLIDLRVFRSGNVYRHTRGLEALERRRAGAPAGGLPWAPRSLPQVIIWLNGTFGVGKTTTAESLLEALPDARLFDTEDVGHLLRPMLKSTPVEDFQEWPPWRSLIVDVATRVLGYSAGILVVPQTVLVEHYWDEISAGLASAGIAVHHVNLHADRATLSRRIEADGALPAGVRQWRLAHLDAYEQSLTWLRGKGQLVDTSTLTPTEVASAISAAAQVSKGLARPAGRGSRRAHPMSWRRPGR